MTQSPDAPGDGFFPPPPRARGRGWWRRFRLAAIWILIGAGAGGGMLAVAGKFWLDRRESQRLAAEGRRVPCVIVNRWSTGGKGRAYYVSLRRLDQDPEATFTRKVARSDWSASHIGQRTIYYYDPATGAGMPEIARGYVEDPLQIVVFGVIGLIVAAIGAALLRVTLREMSLLRYGTEVVTSGMGRQVRILHEGFSADVRAPSDRSSLIRVGPAGNELVALASPDLKRYFFPRLSDIPVERLTREELVVPLLPPQVRPPNPAWRDWLRRKYAGYRGGMVLLFVPVVLVLIFGYLSRASATAVLIPLGILALIELATALAWMRGFWRDIVLWREGDEVHAVVLDYQLSKNRRHLYTLGFSYRGMETRATRTLPEGWPALSAPVPRDAPALTERVVVLVDPQSPKRWALVPDACAPTHGT